jgi:hypothetical protein
MEKEKEKCERESFIRCLSDFRWRTSVDNCDVEPALDLG